MWRSTKLNLATEHCPRALDFYEAGEPYSRDIFAVGVAAHDILEAIGKETAKQGVYLDESASDKVAGEACERLITEGRTFGEFQEGPLLANSVFDGRDLALAYQRDVPLSPQFRYEEEAAINREGLSCPSRGAYLGARIDAVGTVQPGLDDWDEDGEGGPILEIRDFKSSWVARRNELETVQRKIQAVTAWAKWGSGHECLRLVVVNFRLKESYPLDVYPGTPEGESILRQWRDDIDRAIEAVDYKLPDGLRPAVPGVGCLGCPFLSRCSSARGYLSPVYGTAEPVELARAYAVSNAIAEQLKAAAMRAAANGPIEIEDGVVGYVAQSERVLSRDAPDKLIEWWLARARPQSLEQALSMLPGLLAQLKIGRAQAEALLTSLHRGSKEERERRAQRLEKITATKTVRKFGVFRGQSEEITKNEPDA